MNVHKLRAVLEYIRRQGGIPVDGTGRRLSEGEVLVWYGIDGLLTADEQERVKQELAALVEIDEFIEQLKCGIG
jgi:hypothetical protein